MKYVWPNGSKCAVVVSFDFDAESALLYQQPELAKRSLANLEERRYGPRVGVPRILRLLDRLNISSTFFIPAWTVENHFERCRMIRDAGHEIGAHGMMHENVLDMDEVAERAVMAQSVEYLKSELGIQPAGYRSPSWELNIWSPDIISAAGLVYDSSLMGNDVPYTLETANGPLAELPVQWMLDDAPLFRHVYGATNAIADTRRVFNLWSDEFRGIYKEGGIFVVTAHPWISGRPSRIDLLEQIITFMQGFRGVWFATCEEVAGWHLSNAGS